MTNRQWVNNMTDEEFANWCCNRDVYDYSARKCVGIYPHLQTVKDAYTSSEGGLKIWLKQERSEQI